MKAGVIVGLMALMLGWSQPLQASESEDELKIAIIGKLGKFVSGNESQDQFFIISLLHNPFGDLPATMLQHKQINKHPIKVQYIKSLQELKTAQVLFVPQMGLKSMRKLLRSIRGKNILTISDSRGFAESGGMIQMYKVAQKIKLKINLNATHHAGLKVRSSLLKIAQVIEKEH